MTLLVFPWWSLSSTGQQARQYIHKLLHCIQPNSRCFYRGGISISNVPGFMFLATGMFMPPLFVRRGSCVVRCHWERGGYLSSRSWKKPKREDQRRLSVDPLKRHLVVGRNLRCLFGDCSSVVLEGLLGVHREPGF